MAQTRLVFDTLLIADGTPISDFIVWIGVERTTVTADGTVIGTGQRDIDAESEAGLYASATTDATGRWEAELVTGVPLLISYPSSYVQTGTMTRYRSQPLRMTIPDGVGPIRISDILAGSDVAPPDTWDKVE